MKDTGIKLVMAGLDHKRAGLEIREQFAITKKNTARILLSIKDSGAAQGCVIISTCNRTELYAGVQDEFDPAKVLCNALDKNFYEYEKYFIQREGKAAMEHLCRVSAGLDSQIMGEDQIITQVREALELSRGQKCADSFLETLFRLAIQAAKAIKTNVTLKSPNAPSIPGKAVEKLKTFFPSLAGQNAVVIGSGWMGRLVCGQLIKEKTNVTVTIRENKKAPFQIPDMAHTIAYNDRYKAVEKADFVVSATTSPHFTICQKDINLLTHKPKVIVDLAVPRDVEPSIGEINGITLLTIDDISGEKYALASESLSMIDSIIMEHINKFYNWLEYKRENAA
jgi:glutamyl-tRNA reductase